MGGKKKVAGQGQGARWARGQGAPRARGLPMGPCRTGRGGNFPTRGIGTACGSRSAGSAIGCRSSLLSLMDPASALSPRPRLFGTVVVPTDFSGAAGRALPLALALAEHVGADLHLVHAPAPDAGEPTPQQARARLEATCMMYRYTLPGREAVPMRPVVLPSGSAGEAVAAYARQQHAAFCGDVVARMGGPRRRALAGRRPPPTWSRSGRARAACAPEGPAWRAAAARAGRGPLTERVPPWAAVLARTFSANESASATRTPCITRAAPSKRRSSGARGPPWACRSCTNRPPAHSGSPRRLTPPTHRGRSLRRRCACCLRSRAATARSGTAPRVSSVFP